MRQAGLRFFYGYRLAWLWGLCVWQLMLGNVLLCIVHCQQLEHATHAVLHVAVVCDSDLLGQQLMHRHGSVSSINEPSAILASVLQATLVEVTLLPSVFLARPTFISQSQVRFQPPLPPPRFA